VCPTPLAAPYAFGVLSPSELRLFVEEPWDEAVPQVRRARSASELATVVGRAVRELGPRVGLAPAALLEAGLLEAIRAAAPNVELVDFTPDLVELRLIKDADELRAHRRAAELADLGYQAFVRAATPGRRQFEVVAEVEAALLEHGAEDNFMLIGSGGLDVRAMTPPSSRRIQPGDNVITELTPRVDGYYTQICRTLVVGNASADQRRSFQVFKAAADAALSMIRPGVTAGDVARAENDVFRAADLGEYCGPRFTRVRGHGLGLHFDETPAVLEDEPLVLQAGMVFIPHPNTYNPWAGYMVFGDAVVVTDTGCEVLTRTPRELFEA
jgi:Xaa-Pro aminopeptidase